MGTTESKSEDFTGDAQVQVVNRLDAHTDEHEAHEFLLCAILTVVCVKLAITLYQLYVKREKRNALRAARAVAPLNV